MKRFFLIWMIICGTSFAAKQQLAIEYHGMIVHVAAHNPDGSVDVRVCHVQSSFAAMEACDEFENIYNKTIGTIQLIYTDDSTLEIEGDNGVHSVMIDMESSDNEID